MQNDDFDSSMINDIVDIVDRVQWISVANVEEGSLSVISTGLDCHNVYI